VEVEFEEIILLAVRILQNNPSSSDENRPVAQSASRDGYTHGGGRKIDAA